MRGRILGIKKSTILRISLFVNLILLCVSIPLTLFVLKNNFLWFFAFCLFVGLHSLTKSFLFRLDSSCYFGFLLICIAISGGLVYLFHFPYAPLIFLTFAGLASELTFLFSKQKFQLLLGLNMIVSGILGYLYAAKILNLAVFLAIYLNFLFIFFMICVILWLRYMKRG